MMVGPFLVPKEFNSQVFTSEFTYPSDRWFSALSDGTNLKFLSWDIWSISPDGKRALTYTSDSKVALTNLDGTGEIPLDDSLDYYILPRKMIEHQTALWLPNGNVVVLAFEKEDKTKFSINIVDLDGKLKKLEKPSQIIKKSSTLLFISPDGKYLYWKSADICGNQTCKNKFYATKLDDSEQKQILIDLKGAQNMHISPSGQYISYIDNSVQPFIPCYIYKVADDTTTKLTLDDGSSATGFCFGGNHWSPTEDKLLGQTQNGYSILNVPDGKITTLFGVDAGSCYLANWTPDGKRVFLSVCTEENSYEKYGAGQMGGLQNNYPDEFVQSIGARLIDISDGKIAKYPDGGFCNATISPDSKWVLFYLCKNEDDLVVIPSQLLNLDTKEMVSLFQGFVSGNPEAIPLINETHGPEAPFIPHNEFENWFVFWIA